MNYNGAIAFASALACATGTLGSVQDWQVHRTLNIGYPTGVKYYEFHGRMSLMNYEY